MWEKRRPARRSEYNAGKRGRGVACRRHSEGGPPPRPPHPSPGSQGAGGPSYCTQPASPRKLLQDRGVGPFGGRTAGGSARWPVSGTTTHLSVPCPESVSLGLPGGLAGSRGGLWATLCEGGSQHFPRATGSPVTASRVLSWDAMTRDGGRPPGSPVLAPTDSGAGSGHSGPLVPLAGLLNL